ncbi:HNH endonuclease, partial [uncultured Aureimonas sp.]|uniref:HNH endonuclease n=1 Tax=uncultured Aureimonas sp. TaxID=1604662 RepID=UPI0025EFA2B0
MPGRNPSPPPADLLSILKYDPDTGILVWTNTLRGRPPGRRAGNLDKDGYRVVGYAGRTYRAHHLAWLIMKSEWPTQIVDHANGDPDDNRIANLRLSTPSQNSSNRKKPATNTSGYKSVIRHHKSGRWNAQIKDGPKALFL